MDPRWQLPEPPTVAGPCQTPPDRTPAPGGRMGCRGRAGMEHGPALGPWQVHKQLARTLETCPARTSNTPSARPCGPQGGGSL